MELVYVLSTKLKTWAKLHSRVGNTFVVSIELGKF